MGHRCGVGAAAAERPGIPAASEVLLCAQATAVERDTPEANTNVVKKLTYNTAMYRPELAYTLCYVISYILGYENGGRE